MAAASGDGPDGCQCTCDGIRRQSCYGPITAIDDEQELTRRIEGHCDRFRSNSYRHARSELAGGCIDREDDDRARTRVRCIKEVSRGYQRAEVGSRRIRYG